MIKLKSRTAAMVTTVLGAMLLTWLIALWFRGSHHQPILAQPSAPLLGMHIARGDAAHMLAAREAGAEFVVVVFSWRDIEPVPNYLYWETPDAALRAADFAGLQVVARLDRPPQWALDTTSPTPWDLDAYAAFVKHVIARYGDRLAGVIIWNEPNLALEWNGQAPSAAEYAAMLQRVYPVIKETGPNLPVLAAGLAFTIGDDVSAVNDLDYLRSLYAAGAGAFFDVLAAHPYGFGRPPAEEPAADRLNFRRLELHRAIMEESGDAAKPIWITEMGWRTSAPDPADRWQVVTPTQQREYTLAALDLGATYPWLQRVALWELTDGEDGYGYALWQGEDRTTPTYEALVARHRTRSAVTATADAAAVDCRTLATCARVEILAPDVIVRLGDRGELHPHWVHLHRGGERFSPDWEGEFFVAAAQAPLPHTLMLETMQVDQPTNSVWINEVRVGYLQPRTRPDPTSTWVTQRIALPADVLKNGRNTIRIESGQRNPTRTFRWWRWENFQIRNIRLQVSAADAAAKVNPSIAGDETHGWRALASPPGWADTIRVRAGAKTAERAQAIWLTANRAGQLWRGELSAAGELVFQESNDGIQHLIVTDIADDGDMQLVATNAGLFWRQDERAWKPVDSAPPAYAHVVLRHADGWYAGLEGAGLWRADSPDAAWRRVGLLGRTVLDLASDDDRLIAATDNGIYLREAGRWRRLPSLPVDRRSVADANFTPRLFIGAAGEIIVRSEARLLRWDDTTTSWQLFGPAELQGRLYTVLDCCVAGSLVSGSRTGLWQMQQDGAWRRVDGAIFDYLEFSDALRVGEQMIWATTNGVFVAADNAPLATQSGWSAALGAPATVTALLVDPAASLWLAATPVGIFRSADGGASWQAISPPRVVWDMAYGVDGRLYVATTGGVLSTDAVQSDPVSWRRAKGMEGVTFFTVSPDPTDSDQFWAGTWGNDIGVSNDGGATIARLGAGLETLSVLAILRHPTPGQFTIGTIEGLFRSDDGGASWFALPGALSQQTVYALLQGDDGVLWAGAADGLWRSDDYGVTWRRSNALADVTVIRLGRASLPNGELLWAGSEDDGFWWSRDHGASWRFGGLSGRSVYALTAVGEQLIAATDRGLAAITAQQLLTAP
jgi:hypothetical protein